jgi:hypothetical protein
MGFMFTRAISGLLLLNLFTGTAAAQQLPEITFHGQPVMEQGIPVESYALFYEDPTGDTLKSLSVIEQQTFLPPEKIPQIHGLTQRQMPRTKQVIWGWYTRGIHTLPEACQFIQ